MRIEFNELTGTPNYRDYLFMVFAEVYRHEDRFNFLAGLDEGIEYRGKFFPQKLKEPKGWDPNSISSFIEAYKVCTELHEKRVAEEVREWRKFYKTEIKKTGQKKEVIRAYIKKLTGLTYKPNSQTYKALYGRLNQRLKTPK
ncbi:MAG: hypothetical protein AB7O48_10180 [Cyclobacteriaceae bacterium]